MVRVLVVVFIVAAAAAVNTGVGVVAAAIDIAFLSAVFTVSNVFFLRSVDTKHTRDFVLVILPTTERCSRFCVTGLL